RQLRRLVRLYSLCAIGVPHSTHPAYTRSLASGPDGGPGQPRPADQFSHRLRSATRTSWRAADERKTRVLARASVLAGKFLETDHGSRGGTLPTTCGFA